MSALTPCNQPGCGCGRYREDSPYICQCGHHRGEHPFMTAPTLDAIIWWFGHPVSSGRVAEAYDDANGACYCVGGALAVAVGLDYYPSPPGLHWRVMPSRWTVAAALRALAGQDHDDINGGDADSLAVAARIIGLNDSGMYKAAWHEAAEYLEGSE